MQIGSFNVGLFLDSLYMSFTPWWFFVFLGFVVVWYFSLPMRSRWKILLIASLVFCLIGKWQTLATVMLVACLAWLAGLIIEASDKKERKRRRLVLSVASLTLVACLAYIKLNVLLEFATAWFVVPVGISYYTFSVIAYVMDVYHDKQVAERSYWRFLLFVAWFAKILEGPIERYEKLAPQLLEGHSFEWNRFCHGMQLALWGYMKKMIVADRIAVLTTQAFEHPTKYGGLLMLVCAMLAALQLYCDFSGCMDIAGGISQMLGISLEKNFHQPFFSKSAAGFWRRWHITLGTWFKDYVYMPLTVSPRLMRLAQIIKKYMGRKAAMHFMQIIPLAVVWLLTGLWHGTGLNYIVWGAYWGVIIACGILLKKQYSDISKILHIDTSSSFWHAFQMLRTFLLFSIGRIITMPGDVAVSWEILSRLVNDPRPWQLVDKTILDMGLDATNLNVLVIFMALVWLVDCLHERGVNIREIIGCWFMPLREVAYAAAVLSVLVFGVYGPTYSASAFAYMNY